MSYPKTDAKRRQELLTIRQQLITEDSIDSKSLTNLTGSDGQGEEALPKQDSST